VSAGAAGDAMEVKVSQVEGVRFAVTARCHELISDQPTENGGNDTGMTPPELLLSALGSCAAYYAAEYLRTRKLADTGLEVRVTAEKLLQPARLGNFVVWASCPVPLNDAQYEGLQRAVCHCLIHNSLNSPAEIHVEPAVSEPAHAGR